VPQHRTDIHADFWLHGVGSQLFTAWNAPVTLKAVNWYGFEYAPFVPDGLDRVPLDAILFTVRHLGFNALRITFADQTVRSNPVVNQGLAANPQLRGLHALDIMQRIIRRAHDFNLRVILCNSRSEGGRGPETASGLWYTNQYPAATWVADWVTLVKRLRHDSAFVAADLRNEPHDVGTGSVTLNTYLHDGPLWGPYQGTEYYGRDWRYAAQRLGDTLLAINPRLLIIVEGIQLYLNPRTGKVKGGLWGSNLEGVKDDPIELTHQSQLVYSVHEYGPQMWQGDWFNPNTTYASLARRWDRLWGYLLDPTSGLNTPIFVGEFGTCHDYHSCITNGEGWSQGFWFQSFVQYLHQHPQVGWAYWALNPTGPYRPQDPNFYSVVSSDWRHYYPLVIQGLAPLLAEPDGIAGVDPAPGNVRSFLPQPGCAPDRSCAAPPSSTRFGVTEIANVPYVSPADPERMGDFYLPQGAGSTALPAVVILHGGSWNNGAKGTPGTTFLAQNLAQRGYAAFDINYRLSGQGGEYPHDIQDVEDAVAYLETHAGHWHIDPHRIALVGVAAGGYLALMAAYRANVAPFTPPDYPGVQVHVAAVGALFAPVELKSTVQHARGLARVSDLAAYLGATLGQNRALYRTASPLRYTDTAVPTSLWYGTSDPMTPFPPTFELYKRLRQRELAAHLQQLPGAPHRLTELSTQARAVVLTQLLGFLNNVLVQSTS
jgi:endoglucanase